MSKGMKLELDIKYECLSLGTQNVLIWFQSLIIVIMVAKSHTFD